MFEIGNGSRKSAVKLVIHKLQYLENEKRYTHSEELMLKKPTSKLQKPTLI